MDEDYESKFFVLNTDPHGASNQAQLDELFGDKWFIDMMHSVVLPSGVVRTFIILLRELPDV